MRAPVQALVNRIVLAVDRKDCHAPRTCRGDHECACHDEDFFVGKRDGFACLDGGENRLERVST